jgi:site-specific recombinase XerC
MTGEEARTAYLDWLARDRGASPAVVEASDRAVAELMVYVMMSQGRMPDEKALAALSRETLDAFLASRADGGLDEASRERLASAVLRFQRFLQARRRAKPPAET